MDTKAALTTLAAVLAPPPLPKGETAGRTFAGVGAMASHAAGGRGRSSNYPRELSALADSAHSLTGNVDLSVRARVRRQLVTARLAKRGPLDEWEAQAALDVAGEREIFGAK